MFYGMNWAEALWKACSLSYSPETPWRWLRRLCVISGLSGGDVSEEALTVASEFAQAAFWNNDVRRVFLGRLRAALPGLCYRDSEAPVLKIRKVVADDESVPTFVNADDDPAKIRFANASGIAAAFLSQSRHSNDWRHLVCTLHHWTTPEELLCHLHMCSDDKVKGREALLGLWREVAPDDFDQHVRCPLLTDRVLLKCRQESVIAWMLVARKLFVMKDVARMIAKMAFNDTRSWLRSSSYQASRVMSCSQVASVSGAAGFDVAEYVLSFTALQIARVVNQRSMQLFCHVDPRRDLLAKDVRKCESVMTMAYWCGCIVSFFSTVILFRCESWERMHTLFSLVVDAAACLIDLKDYFGAMVLYSVAQSKAVRRLRLDPMALEKLVVLSPNAGYRELRRATMHANDCIPSVSIWISDLIFLEEGNASKQNGLINVAKLSKQSEVAYKWLRHKNSVHERIVWDVDDLFEGAALLETIMETFPVEDEEMLMCASLKLRPKDDDEVAQDEQMETRQRQRRDHEPKK